MEGIGSARVGAVALAVLAGGMAFALWTSGRVFGGVVLRAHAASLGPLRVGSKVRLAGEVVGEVRTIGATANGVELAVTLTARVPRNCRMFVALPSVLGEAHLTFAPPADGATAAAPFGDGDAAEIDAPPDIDRLLVTVDASLRNGLELLGDLKPAWTELTAAVRPLRAHADAVELGAHLANIVAQTRDAVGAARDFVAALRAAGGIEHVRAAARALGDAADALGPELRALGSRLDDTIAKIGLPDAAGAHLREALGRIRNAVTVGDALVGDVRRLIARIEAGQGTVGAFLTDREIYDDFHDTHRTIKANPLRFLLPTVKEEKRR